MLFFEKIYVAILTRIARKRVLEKDSKFIPQVLTQVGWEGVDVRHTYTWISAEAQIKNCAVPTLEEARKNLRDYIIRTTPRRPPNPIIHTADE